MPLFSGEQFAKLWQIVLPAFDQSDLTRVVRFSLDTALEDIVGTDGSKKDVVFDLITWTEKEGKGRTLDLLRGLRKERPNNAELEKFCAPYLDVGTAPAPVPNGTVRAAVRRFVEAFYAAERPEQFQYLNANKELHDVLHDLQGNQKLIAAVAARPAGQSVPNDACLALSGWVKDVERAVAETEFPKAPPAWVAKFTTAVGDLFGQDPNKAGRAAERLAALPARAQGELNAELVKCARRLDTAELVGLLDGILLAANSDAAIAGTAELRAAVTQFRVLCNELPALIRDHDLCQQVSDALGEGPGLRKVTSLSLTDWPEAWARLTELAAGRPGDFRVARSLAAAQAFADAAPSAAAAAFEDLAKQFADLFLHTDKTLLKVTNRLPVAAMTVENALARFQ